MDDIHKLKVLLATSAPAYTDLTDKAFDFSRDLMAVPLEDDGFLYLGRRKPFGMIFVDVAADYRNGATAQLAFEYWDEEANDGAGAWTSYALPVEDTLAFNRSGFIKWEPLIQEGTAARWGESEVNGESAFWIRLSTSADLTAATKLNGINIVFADDQDLKAEDFSVLKLLPKDENDVKAESHILSHVAARDGILQELRNSGRVKAPANAGLEDLDEWDLFRSGQIRQAAIFGALEKIYFNASDAPDDIYFVKAKGYASKRADAMKLFLLSLDTDDDGLESTEEKSEEASSGRFRRR